MAEPLSAQDAAQVLGDLPRYEESLTARAAGLTLMLWGLVAAGTFMTYASFHGLLDHEAAWTRVLGFAWVAWAAAGVAATLFVWRSHAIALHGRHRDRPTLLRIAAGLVAFAVLLYGLVALYLSPLADGWNMAGLVLLAHALLTLLVALWLRSPAARPVRRSLSWAAAGLLLVGLLLTASSVEMGVVLMLGALLVGGAWFLAGIATYAQG